jgi:exopolysaccharide biosynthesis polyprenyl glycosylphosphotransferase
MPEPTTEPVGGASAGAAAAPGHVPLGMPLHDIRLKRELTHRRLAVAMLRRVMRIITLHFVDGALLAGVILGVAALWHEPALRDMVPAFVVIFLLSLNASGAYRPVGARLDWRRILSGIMLGAIILFSIAVMSPEIALPQPLIVPISAIGFGVLLTGRRVTVEVVRQAHAHGIGLRRAIVIGNLSEVGEALQQLRDKRSVEQYIVGHLAPDREPDPAALGTIADLPRTLDDLDIQEVVLATNLTDLALRDVANECFQRGTSLYVFPSVLSTVDCRVEPLYVGSCSLMHLTPTRIEVPALLVKRLFDIVAASAALILFGPLMILIALAIKVDTRGPVFFRARRVGLGGQIFDMWKFRSMYADAQQREHELAHLNIYSNGTFKIVGDPRVTRVGRLLRRTSMDELPQLFNVLIGNMSLVGPRPALPADLERYEPHHFQRLTVIPGMTGPWQVGGRNLITDFETIIRMERSYIQSWSLLLDIKILMRTPGVVWRGEGAY